MNQASKYWCSQCGAAVTAEAEVCTRCGVHLHGIRESTVWRRFKLRLRHNTQSVEAVIGNSLFFLIEHSRVTHLVLLTPLLAATYYLWNNHPYAFMGAIAALTAFSAFSLAVEDEQNFVGSLVLWVVVFSALYALAATIAYWLTAAFVWLAHAFWF